MKQHVIFVWISLAVSISFALVCKNCSLDCKEPTDEQCLEPGETQRTACLQEVFKDTEGNTLEERKCVIYQDDIDQFECVEHPGYKTIRCHTCFKDMCNNLPPIKPGQNSTQPAKNATRLSGS